MCIDCQQVYIQINIWIKRTTATVALIRKMVAGQHCGSLEKFSCNGVLFTREYSVISQLKFLLSAWALRLPWKSISCPVSTRPPFLIPVCTHGPFPSDTRGKGPSSSSWSPFFKKTKERFYLMVDVECWIKVLEDKSTVKQRTISSTMYCTPLL